MASESQYFRDQKAKSLNYTVNSKEKWAPEASELLKVNKAIERVKFDLESGILLKLKMLRERELEQTVKERCYQDTSINFMQGQMCEDFHYTNDFKLNVIGSFFKDHLSKHLVDFEDNCVVGSAIAGLSSNEAKDRAFLKCKDSWISNFRDNVSQDLELKARTLLGNQL